MRVTILIGIMLLLLGEFNHVSSSFNHTHDTSSTSFTLHKITKTVFQAVITESPTPQPQPSPDLPMVT